MNKIIIISLLSSFALFGCSKAYQEVKLDTPTDCVKSWIQAIRDMDIDRANKCLSKKALAYGPYSGGKEALLFWHDEIAGDRYSLDSNGFKGEWTTSSGSANGKEYVLVHAVMPDGPSEEAIWVVDEDGTWKIEGLFVNSPKK